MDNSRQSSSFTSSAASAQLEQTEFEDMETMKIKNHAKEMLKSRIFLGRYIERRLVNKIIGYRDVVLVSPAEVELKQCLLEVQHKLRIACPNIHWIGITDSKSYGYSSAGICLWTEIDNQPFGPFWFQIKSIKFRQNEIIVTLKCLRHLSDAYLEIEPILTGATQKNKETINKLETSVESLNETYIGFLNTFKNVLSISNVKEFITFLFALVIAIFTGSTAFINFLGNFVLALIREMSILIKNSTPMLLGLLDFLSKIVGGFYILLAMFFRPSQPIPGPSRSVYSAKPNRLNEYSREFD
ncbi:hypothetical protein K1T71_001350 [Dendrolimus kikuchii]|uniref:Uncharacterized protein n=1 Tax=Dendrolimus kikuchii TaxID=765133 RepID=A0ACC1DHD0_9NEOP|nr:hypothetical protein K1T71_001350 [Dendrolimus kikuchii]